MRILIISDIHANLDALEAVIAEAGEFDVAWCLGDIVGYGPDPNECVSRIREIPNLLCILGNHDAAALKLIDINSFNPEARNSIQWTQNQLTDSNLTFLKELPEKLNDDNVTLSHGSPRHPVWEYLLDVRTATANFDHFETDYCFVGHTHIPVIYSLDNERASVSLRVPQPNSRIKLSNRAILNPGSVGQPRDRDPRAAFAIYDPENFTWEYRRVGYDIQAVQQRMQTADLPQRHILRLSAGW